MKPIGIAVACYFLIFVVQVVTCFNLQQSSLQDLIAPETSHLSFIGSFQAVFPGSTECTDACIYTSQRGDTSCAVYEQFYPTQISVSPSVWVWESEEIPAGEYNAMLATDKLCWEAVGVETDLGVMEPVAFTVPSYGSTVRLVYNEDYQRVTAHVYPLVEQFNCDGKPFFLPDWDNYGGPFEEQNQELYEEYEGYLLSQSSEHEACDFPQLLAAQYNISLIGVVNLPDTDLLMGSGTSDPFLQITLPDADPLGQWETLAKSDCGSEKCSLSYTLEGRTVQLGTKVGGSRMEIKLLDYDIGFEWQHDYIGGTNTSLIHCSFADVRSDATCSNFGTETTCVSWKASQYNHNPNLWDPNSCKWVNGRCRGCEVNEDEQSCLNNNCFWRENSCTDLCLQDTWLSMGSNEPCAKYNITLDEWTFDPDIPCAKVRQEAMPFTASINSLLFEAGDIKFATSGFFESIDDSECPLTNEEEAELENLDCDLMFESLDFDVVRRAHPLCVPCQSSLDYDWKRNQGYAYVSDYTSRIDSSTTTFALAKGSLVIQQPQSYFTTDQGTVVYARKVTAPKWMSFSINMAARVWFFRSAGYELEEAITTRSGGDMDMIPTWVEEGITTNGQDVLSTGEATPLGLDGGYDVSTRVSMNLYQSSEEYAGFWRNFAAGDQIHLGGSSNGVTQEAYFDQVCVDNEEDNFTSSACSQSGGEEYALQNQEYPSKMYVIMVRPLIDVTDTSICDVTIDSLSFVVTLSVYIVPLVGYTSMVWWFLHDKLDYNFDMIPSYVARQVLTKGPTHNILGSIVSNYKSGLRGDTDDVYFRRNLHWTSKAIALMCWSPLVLWTSFGMSLIGTTTPLSFGLCILFIGNAFLLGGCATLAWRRRNWRMTDGIRMLYIAAAVMAIAYLVFVSIFDSCGAKFFSVTAAFLTVNMVIMSQSNFLACPHVAAAFREMDSRSGSHDAVMSDILNSLDTNNDKGTEHKLCQTQLGITSYIAQSYSIDSKYSLFKHSNAFGKSMSVRKGAVRIGGIASIVVLLIYCTVVRFLLPDDDISALGISITVILLDSAVSMLRNGLMSWNPSYITILMLLSRIFLVTFNSEYWIVGHSFAYTVFGIAVCKEIVDQKMPRMSGLDAGAVAYFSRGENVHEEKKRRDIRARNIAGSPVFVAGYLLIIMALVILTSILTYGDNVPVLNVLGYRLYVTSIAVSLVVINILVLLLLAANRAMYLQSNQLLNTNKFFCVKKVSMASLLSLLLAVYMIITGILLFAVTGSNVWIQICVFVPPICVLGGYASSQYFKNDCSFTLTPKQRARDIAIWKMKKADEGRRA
jgi:hypothetical protein